MVATRSSGEVSDCKSFKGRGGSEEVRRGYGGAASIADSEWTVGGARE
jgi:hypothetical protein